MTPLSLASAPVPVAGRPALAAMRAVFVNPAIAALLTLALLGFCTRELLVLQDITGQPRPYTILYLIPVAIGAAFLGTRGGVVAAAIAVVLARVYLFNDEKHGLALLSPLPMGESIELASLAAGTLSIAAVTGSLRTTLSRLAAANQRLRDANAQLVESEQQRRTFNRDVLLAVTGGKLRLVEPEEMPPADMVSGEPRLTLPLREPRDATELRRTLSKLGREMGMDDGRLADLTTGTTEAATNAIKHGRGGEARVWIGDDTLFVLVQDRGEGIAPHHLARATLEQGYSTQISLGMGFHLMLQTSDTLALCTGPQGTTVMLRVSKEPQATAEESLLARYFQLA